MLSWSSLPLPFIIICTEWSFVKIWSRKKNDIVTFCPTNFEICHIELTGFQNLVCHPRNQKISNVKVRNYIVMDTKLANKITITFRNYLLFFPPIMKWESMVSAGGYQLLSPFWSLFSFFFLIVQYYFLPIAFQLVNKYDTKKVCKIAMDNFTWCIHGYHDRGENMYCGKATKKPYVTMHITWPSSIP